MWVAPINGRYSPPVSGVISPYDSFLWPRCVGCHDVGYICFELQRNNRANKLYARVFLYFSHPPFLVDHGTSSSTTQICKSQNLATFRKFSLFQSYCCNRALESGKSSLQKLETMSTFFRVVFQQRSVYSCLFIYVDL